MGLSGICAETKLVIPALWQESGMEFNGNQFPAREAFASFRTSFQTTLGSGSS
jgi:hypothetical protein